MGDRKPPGNLFDFPISQPDSAPRRGQVDQDALGDAQQGLFESESSLEREDSRADRGGLESGSAGSGPEELVAGQPRDEEQVQAETVEEDAIDGLGGVGARWLAGGADILFHGTALVLVVIALMQLGLPMSVRLWPGFAVFLASFSFLYVTLPLAFWGKTPGMAWQGLKALDQNGMSLTYSQTVMRWLGAVITVALLGLPVLWALSGRSLADRISGSWTIVVA